MDSKKISLCLCVWNTSHLLSRSIYTYSKQDFPVDDWELIVIDDNSMDDVMSVLLPYENKLNIKYCRLEHNYGMRGNTVAFNTAFELAEGKIISETTPETMFQPNIVRRMYEGHLNEERAFLAFKTYNLTPQIQIIIDQSDWQSDIMNISKLEGWNDPWIQNNVSNTNFRTHQTCSIRKDVFYEITKGLGFPLFMDYGSEDPWYSHVRETNNIKDITIMDVMPIHQWHSPFQYWMSKGYAPMLNKYAHTNSNYMNDKSGHIDSFGTAKIWDKCEQPDGSFLYPNGCADKLSENDKNSWSSWDAIVRGTGCKLV